MRRRPAFRLRVFTAASLVALQLSGCAYSNKGSPGLDESVELSSQSNPRDWDDESKESEAVLTEAPADTRVEPPAAAPIQTSAITRGARPEKKTTLDFADVAIDGELAKPQGDYAVQRNKSKHESLVKIGGPQKFATPGSGGGLAVAQQPAPKTPPPPPAEPAKPDPTISGNTYEKHEPNRFTSTAEDRFSTFAIDVDTASYALARRYLNSGSLPPTAAVRVEEFVNYFKYKYPAPQSGAFAVHLDGAPSPFGRGKHLLKVGVQGKNVAKSQRKPANLVFLVDVSGSMASADKLPLVKESLNVLVRNLNENDTVSLVTYAGYTAEVLSPTPATDTKKIMAAINSLGAGGGTSMGSGFQRAYENAMKRVGGGVNSRVIVLTDGDTNIGPNLTADSMLESVRKYVSEGVTLSTVGYGMGNYRDDLMEKLADKGNGNCFYIDTMKEARKVFETQIAGTLEVIAKDVKIQVDFNPETVKSYRLVGYENRDIADRDFRNDKVDAGEIGAGHNVTALYEVELTGVQGDLATVRIRAKEPTGSIAKEQEFRFGRDHLYASMDSAPADFRFATAVAGTADILRGNPAAEGWSLAMAQSLAEGATEGIGDRKEFAHLVGQARRLLGEKNVSAAR